MDRGVIELLGPHGLTIFFYSLSTKISKLDTGLIPTYALYFTMASLSMISVVCSQFLFDQINLIHFSKLMLVLTFSLYYLSKQLQMTKHF